MIGPDLYEGTAGIALFLAYLARATGRGGLRRVGPRRLHRRRLPASPSRRRCPHRRIHRRIGAAVHRLAPLPPGGRRRHSRRCPAGSRPCPASGRPGPAFRPAERIGGLCPRAPATGGTRTPGRSRSPEPAAVTCSATPSPSTEGSGGAGPQEAPDLFSACRTRAGGIAAALAQLGQVTSDPRFGRAARRAISYEQAHFDVDLGNWPDLRPHAFRGVRVGVVSPARRASASPAS